MDITFPPGVTNKSSRKTNKVNWREANLVRWDNDTLEPVGGWESLDLGITFGSSLKKIHRYVANDGARITAYLCESNVYVDPGTGTIVEITPTDGLTPPDNTGQGGFGDGLYGVGTYGTPRDATNRFDAVVPMYTIDNWGEELRVMTSADGRLLRWSPSTPSTELVAVTNAPTQCRCFVITPQRFIIVFGPDGIKHRFEWCDQEDDTNWTPSTTSKAGGFNVEPASPITTARNTSFGVVFFTNRTGYLITFIGLPFVHAYDEITGSVPPYSPDSLIEIPNGLAWASYSGFWIYNGVNVAPVECSIWDWIEDRIDITATRFTGTMVSLITKYEVWWFFNDNIENSENTHLVIFNYLNQTWSMGTLSRACGYSVANDPFPLLGTATTVYRHETGYAYPGADMPWVESFTLNSNNGVTKTTLKKMLPEVTGDRTAVNFTFAKRDDPNDPATETYSGTKSIRSNGFVDIRETARQLRMRVNMVGSAKWSLGMVNIDSFRRGQQ